MSLDQEKAMILASMSPTPAGWEPREFTIKRQCGKPEKVFGWAREPFGVFILNAQIEPISALSSIAMLVHLAAECGIALFVEDKAAAIAGEIAARLDDWAALNTDDAQPGRAFSPAWNAASTRAGDAWVAFGIMPTWLTDDDGNFLWTMTTRWRQ